MFAPRSHVASFAMLLVLAAGCDVPEGPPPLHVEGARDAGAGGSDPGGGGAPVAAGGNEATGVGGTRGAGGSRDADAGGSHEPARGAVSLHILGGPGCSLGEQFQDFPLLPSGHPVTDAGVVQLVTDGTTTAEGEPVHVECSDRYDGSGISPLIREASITIGAAGSQRSVHMLGGYSIDVLVFTVSVETPEWPRAYRGDAVECRVRNGVSTCEKFVSEDGADVCALGPSYLHFENCSGP